MTLKCPELRGFHGIIETAPKSACNTRRGLTLISTQPIGGLPVMVPKSCSIEDCPKQRRARGLCETHYARLRRHGDPLKNLVTEKPKACTFEDCGKPVAGRGLCSTHWARWRTHGDPSVVILGSKPQYIGCKVE